MNHNPYSPPASDLSEPAMEIPSRPISVWLLLGWMAIFTSSFTYGITRFFWIIVTRFSEVRGYPRLAIEVLWRIVFLLFLITVIVSLYKRKSWSRWVAVLLLSACMLWIIFSPDRSNYSSSAESAGAMAGKYVVVPLLLGWWIYSAAFSAKSKRYFGLDE